MNKPFFTVFTPIFNRSEYILRVYDSLCKQKYQDFEWLIIDDGSTDNPEGLINDLKTKSKFNILYYYKSNGGKHSTFAYAYSLANGEFLINLDSDDALSDNCLSTLYNYWFRLNDKDRFIGITGLCIDQYGKLVGDKFPSDLFISNSLDCQYKHKIKGEKFGMQRLSILKEFSFPETNTNGYFGEGYIWDRIALKYDTLYINEVLRIYFLEKKSSIMNNLNSSKNLVSTRIYMLDRVNMFNHYFWFSPLHFIYYTFKYLYLSFLLKISFFVIVKEISSYSFKILSIILSPLAKFYSLFYGK